MNKTWFYVAFLYGCVQTIHQNDSRFGKKKCFFIYFLLLWFFEASIIHHFATKWSFWLFAPSTHQAVSLNSIHHHGIAEYL